MATTPYSVAYPVNFRSGGDTTRDAFRKHIDEIERIYGIINAVNADKVSSSGVTSAINSAIAAHQNSSNPHPNWRPSYSFSDITGTIDASKVSGKLTNANIDYGKVNGLGDYVRGLIPTSNGITAISTPGAYLDGYAKFGNVLMIQWGTHFAPMANRTQEATNTVSFPISFAQNCFAVSMTTATNHHSGSADVWAELIVSSLSKTSFSYMFQYVTDAYTGMANFEGQIGVSYIAIGV